jgi:hypothetical protein
MKRQWRCWTNEERARDRRGRREARQRRNILRELDEIAASMHASDIQPRIGPLTPGATQDETGHHEDPGVRPERQDVAQ